MRTSRKWRKMAPLYKHFAGGDYDFSDEAALAMFLFESRGIGNLSLDLMSAQPNGYAVGKHWMDVSVAMWNEDLRMGLLTKSEIYSWYPDWHWWLDKVVKL